MKRQPSMEQMRDALQRILDVTPSSQPDMDRREIMDLAARGLGYTDYNEYQWGDERPDNADNAQEQNRA